MTSWNNRFLYLSTSVQSTTGLFKPPLFGGVSNFLLTSSFGQFLTAVSLHSKLTAWISPRPISDIQLHTLLYFHLCPIYLVVFKGSYNLLIGISHLEGGFTLRCLQRLSRPDLATLLCRWSTTDTPVVSPTRSSRTKVSSSQISSAYAG